MGADAVADNWVDLAVAVMLQAVGDAQRPAESDAAEAGSFLALPVAVGLAVECGVDPGGFRGFVEELPDPEQPGLPGLDWVT